MRSLQRSATTLLLAATVFTAGEAGAQFSSTLDISTKPLVTVISVKPNIMVVLDDSGSMSFELSMDALNDGSLWFDQATNSYVKNDGSGDFFDNNDGGDRKTSYIFPWTEGPGRNSHYTVPPFIQYAFARSPSYNRAFYDPAVTYEPWPDVGGLTFDDSDPTSARFHALSNDTGGGSRGTRTINLMDTTLCSTNDDFEVQFVDDMVVPAGTTFTSCGGFTTPVDCRWGNCNSPTTESDREIDPIVWNPGEVFIVTEVGEYSVDGTTPDISCEAPHSPEDYKIFEFAPSQFRGTDDVVTLGPDGRCMVRLDQNDLDMDNFANWFTYYRKRHQATRNGIVASLGDVRIPLRSGYFTINNRNTVSMFEFESDPTSADDEREDMLEDIMLERFGGGTPNRRALQHAGGQFENNSDIIQFECQKNFTMFFTDGFSQTDLNFSVGNRDGQDRNFDGFNDLKVSGVAPYDDDFSNTLADIAMFYYRDFDAPGGFVDDKVPTPGACGVADTVTQADCNNDLHMNTYMVTLNARGSIYGQTIDGVTYETVADAYENPPAWPNPNATRDRTAIDDLYHAAVNGRGLLLNATTPQALRDRFQEALTDIAAKSRSSSALTASSTTRASTDTQLFQSTFDSETWTGNINALSLEGGQNWVASDGLGDDAFGTRTAITFDGNSTVEFDWDNLTSETQTAFLDVLVDNIALTTLIDEYGGADTAANAVIDYLAGNTEDEQRNGGILRNRGFINLDGQYIPNLLGDIVNSVPVVMGPRNEGWARLPDGQGGGDLYQDYIDNFKQNGRNPKLSLYVGSNDGALHAFDAADGEELFAYFPQMVVPKMGFLPDPDYDHQFYVDGTPVISDAFDGSWKTVLVGSLGAGGRGYFALDVTNPRNPDLLWEFSSSDDSDMGFSLGEARITRTPSGTWIAVFGNGFGSDGNDGYLYALDLFSGAVLAKVPTTTGTPSEPAGLASPTILLDLNEGVGTEAVYAGDLQGRMWRISADGDPGGWSVAGGTPVFTAEATNGDAQPITAAPAIALTPNGDIIIYFGTGKFFERLDGQISSSDPVESFYAVVDTLETPANLDRGDLRQLDLGSTTIDGDSGRDVRTITDNGASSGLFGFFVDLFVSGEGKGERVVTTPSVRFGRLLFATFQPVEDICTPGGVPRLYALDARTGSGLINQTYASVELAAAGSAATPPVLIDTTGDYDNTPFIIPENEDGSCPDGYLSNGSGACVKEDEDDVTQDDDCVFGRPVIAIEPGTQDRINLGCLQEGRVHWGEKVLIEE
ncbi:MAG: PilC/PilY family type IV pilus protein [Planctomycetota bacterium]